MGNRSHLAPWTKDHFPRRVLDVGTGTGDWCFDFAEEYPETELIIGTDLSNIQPDVGPPNVQFIIDDSSQEWLDDDLDYVHTRDTNGCWEVRQHLGFYISLLSNRNQTTTRHQPKGIRMLTVKTDRT